MDYASVKPSQRASIISWVKATADENLRFVADKKGLDDEHNTVYGTSESYMLHTHCFCLKCFESIVTILRYYKFGRRNCIVSPSKDGVYQIRRKDYCSERPSSQILSVCDKIVKITRIKSHFQEGSGLPKITLRL